MTTGTAKSGSGSASDETRLCLACGICCEGLLHSRAVLKADEIDRARSLGLEVLDREEPSFRLPCRKFDGCCQIYDSRPSVCGRFRCALLRKLGAGDIALDDALEIVAEARRLIVDAAAALPGKSLVGQFRGHLNRAPDVTDGELTDIQRLRLVVLAMFLDRHFVLERDGYFYSANAVQSEDDR